MKCLGQTTKSPGNHSYNRPTPWPQSRPDQAEATAQTTDEFDIDHLELGNSKKTWDKCKLFLKVRGHCPTYRSACFNHQCRYHGAVCYCSRTSSTGRSDIDTDCEEAEKLLKPPPTVQMMRVPGDHYPYLKIRLRLSLHIEALQQLRRPAFDLEVF